MICNRSCKLVEFWDGYYKFYLIRGRSFFFLVLLLIFFIKVEVFYSLLVPGASLLILVNAFILLSNSKL